jgi:hypothetical protein
LAKTFDSKTFIKRWKQRKEEEEWLFALAVVVVGLEREGNLDGAAEEEIAAACSELDIPEDALRDYLEKNRRKLLRFLDSSPE